MDLLRQRSGSIFFTITFVLLMYQSSWAQRDLRDIPAPDPVAERAAMRVDDAVEVELFASDPMLSKPIHMNFDPKGRLWIASSSVYPQIKPGETANDKIIVLEDTDNDGRADKSTVFAENLLIPTGILPDENGVYVAASTQLLYFADTDGDGKADSKEIVLSGFGTEDTHHLLHTLRWGPDGWLYMNQSIYIHSHVETPWGTKHLDGGGIWRFHPPTQRLEVVCKGFVNPWGHIFDSWGQSFATDGAYGEGINYVFPGSVFVTSPGAERIVGGLNPGSPKHCGLEILSGDHIPPELRGHMMTNDFRSHRVCRFGVSRTADGYVSQQQPETIVSQHIAFRPIDVKQGPDGTVYVADWYNPIIQHGEVDFRDDRRDRTHGRVWRIRWKDRKIPKYAFRSDATTDELVAMLDDSLDLTRQWTRLALAKRSFDEVKSKLAAWVKASKNPEIQTRRLLEQSFVYEACDQFDPNIASQLAKHPDARLRSMAIRIINRHLDVWPEGNSLIASAVNDEDWQVRVEAVCALRASESADNLAIALQAVSKPMNSSTDFTLWSFVRESEPVWNAPNAARPAWTMEMPKLLYAAQAARGLEVLAWVIETLSKSQQPVEMVQAAVRVVASRADTKTAGDMLRWMADQKGSDAEKALPSLLNILADGTATRDVSPAGADKILMQLFETATRAGNNELAQVVAQSAGRWSIAPMFPVLESALSDMLKDAAKMDSAASIVDGLGNMKDDRAKQLLRDLAARPKLDAKVRTAAIRAIAKADLALAVQMAVQSAQRQTEAPFGGFGLAALANRKGGPEAISQALENSEAWSPESARAVLEEFQSNSVNRPDLVDVIRRLGKLDEHRWVLTKELSQELVKMAAESGDPARGEKLYRQASLQCSRCHPIGTAGGQIGPNLISVGGSSPVDYIVESILDPDAKLKEGFQTIVALTNDGEVVTGLQKSRTAEQLQLLTADGKTVVLAAEDIDSEKTGKSLMPAGLVDTLSKQQLADLVRFLSEVGRTKEYTVSSEPWVRTWQTAKYTDAGHHVLNRTSLDALATDEKAIQWQPIVSKVNGHVALAELDSLQPHANVPPVSAIRTTVNCKRGGPVRFETDAKAQVRFWLNGKPTDLAKSDTIELAEGLHQIVFAINRGPEEIGVRIVPADQSPAVVEIGEGP
jgi:putative heme-binding domain-containing protein